MIEKRNLTASIRQRLLNKAHGTNRPYNEILQYYAIERFLYRLSQSPHADKFILKGALLFLAWGTSIYRPTRDIDFLGFTANELDSLMRIIQVICEQQVEPDGLIFDAQSANSARIREDADYEGVRVNLTGYLGKAKIPLQIDIGFGDIVYPAPVTLQYPTLLRLSAPRLRGYPPETVLAEKLQALVFLGNVNSRMKDFYDLWVLAKQFDFDGRELQEAILHTFQQRNTALPEEIPVGLSDSFTAENQAQWQAFIKRTRIAETPFSFSDIIRVLKGLTIPLLQISASGNTFTGVWKSGGPWKFPKEDIN
jgi:predicted nucleotidyltransferase component of viral defense system